MTQNTKTINSKFFVADRIMKQYTPEAAFVFSHIAFWCCKGKFDASPRGIATMLGLDKRTARKYRDIFIREGWFVKVASKYIDGTALQWNFDTTNIEHFTVIETYQKAFSNDAKPDNGIALIEIDIAELPKNITSHKAKELRGLLIFKGFIRDKLVNANILGDEVFKAKYLTLLAKRFGLCVKTIAKYIAKLVKQGFIKTFRKDNKKNGSLRIFAASKLKKAIFDKSKYLKQKIAESAEKAKNSFLNQYQRKPLNT